MRKFLLLIFLSVGLSQITFTDEEVKTLENQFLQLEVQVDSLSTQDSLKTIEIDLLEQKISLLEEDVALTEKKAKLVKPSWYENKWLYFTYGVVSVAVPVYLAGQLIN